MTANKLFCCTIYAFNDLCYVIFITIGTLSFLFCVYIFLFFSFSCPYICDMTEGLALDMCVRSYTFEKSKRRKIKNLLLSDLIMLFVCFTYARVYCTRRRGVFFLLDFNFMRFNRVRTLSFLCTCVCGFVCMAV